MQKVSSFINVAIAFVKGNCYRMHFWYMSKDKTVNVMGKSDLKEKSGANSLYNI